jgi:hypothetical protein
MAPLVTHLVERESFARDAAPLVDVLDSYRVVRGEEKGDARSMR